MPGHLQIRVKAVFGEVVVEGAECIDDSFPGFVDVLCRSGARMANHGDTENTEALG